MVTSSRLLTEHVVRASARKKFLADHAPFPCQRDPKLRKVFQEKIREKIPDFENEFAENLKYEKVSKNQKRCTMESLISPENFSKIVWYVFF